MQKLQSFLLLSSVAIFSVALALLLFMEVHLALLAGPTTTQRTADSSKLPYIGQETGPGLVFVQGGTFTMGQVEDDLTGAWDNIPRRVTVSSFYMDEAEVTNYYWLEYLFLAEPGVLERDILKLWTVPSPTPWFGGTHGHTTSPTSTTISGTRPTATILLWASPGCRPMTSASGGPTVSMSKSWCAKAFWFTTQPDKWTTASFSTEAYLDGQYDEAAKAADGIKDLRPNGVGYRNVGMSDGILLPDYRLPTEAEWEYAALSLIGNSGEELITSRRTYPWDGHYVRNDDSSGKFYGEINANFVRGTGDYMGVAGALNDNADVTAPVYSYAPNDYGLYNMAGNVSEWVMDVYRPGTLQDAQEFRPFRGNVFSTKLLDSEGNVTDKLDYVEYDIAAIEEFLERV